MPVKDDKFYNREEETAEAVGYIRSLQCFSVIGERRIGKTSFLLHILSIKTLLRHEIGPEDYVIVYLNMSSLHEITKDAFIGAIVERIKKQARVKVGHMNIFDTLKTLVEKLASNNKNLIIALDEFETIVPILGDLSYWLRFIFQSQNVVAITASQTTIGALCSDSSASPLFNIFGNITLGLFSEEETKTMIEDMFHEGGKGLKDDEVSFLANLAGGNPWLIQLLGFHYYNKKMTKDEFENKMLDQARDVFGGYWEHLSEEEKEFLLNVETSNNERIGYDLEKRGLIIGEEGRWRIFSKLFQKFLKKVEKKEEIQKSKEIEKKKEKIKENGKKPFDWTRAIDILLAFFVGIASGIATPYIQKWLNLYPRFLEELSSKIDPSLIISVFAFFIALIAIMKFHQRSDQ